jgi:hypothetical protein
MTPFRLVYIVSDVSEGLVSWVFMAQEFGEVLCRLLGF